MNPLTQITPYAKNIVELASSLGCISKAQLMLLFKDAEHVDDGSFIKLNKTLANLRKNRFITYKNDIVMPFPKPAQFSMETLDCVWGAIDKAKYSNGAYSINDLKCAFSNKPVQIVMINSEDNIIYNIMEITENNNATNMAFVRAFIISRRVPFL